METIISILLGVGLSAAVGFRIFVPFLVINLAHQFGVMDLSSGFQWMGTMPALILFSTATLLEVVAYYIPWFDNLLDTITTPLAMICGTLVMASAIVEMEPMIKWTLAIIAGGGTAGLIKGATTTTRAASSLTTGGIANPIISTVEAGSSVSLAILAIVIPILAGVLVIFLIFYFIRKLFRRKSIRKTQA